MCRSVSKPATHQETRMESSGGVMSPPSFMTRQEEVKQEGEASTPYVQQRDTEEVKVMEADPPTIALVKPNFQEVISQKTSKQGKKAKRKQQQQIF